MTEQELLKYCFFYKGEALCPPRYDQKDEGKLWQAEKVVCEELQHMVDTDNPRTSIAKVIAAYVAKWSPWTFEQVMRVYFAQAPDIKDVVMSIYN